MRWLGTDRLTYRRLAVLIRQLPPDSALGRALGLWTQAEHLLAYVGNVGEIANWQRGGGKKDAFPKALRSPAEREADEAKRNRLHERLVAQRQEGTVTGGS